MVRTLDADATFSVESPGNALKVVRTGGAAGAVAMAPQIVGRPAPEIYDAYVAGDLMRARQCHYLVARVYDILFKSGSMYVGVKEAMNLLGKPGGHMRAPMLPFTEEQRAEVRAILRETGFLSADVAE